MKPRLQSTSGLALAAVVVLGPLTAAHTWVERTMRIASNGTMVGAPGYERSHVVRGSPGYTETKVTGQIPTNGANTINATDLVTPRPEQLQLSVSTTWPMLNVSGGDWVALQYQENGHVSLPQNSENKTLNRGTVYVYGTTTNDLSNLAFVDVHLKWNKDGTGGNRQGRLLATRNYDDGQCYQINSGTISVARQKVFTKNATSLMGADLWCQTDVQIPTNLTVGSTYTMIWIWDWPTMSTDNVAVPPAYIKMNATTPTTDPYVVTSQNYVSVVDFGIVEPCSASLGTVKGPLCDDGNSTIATSANFMTFKEPTDWNVGAVGDQLANPFQVAVAESSSGDSKPSESTGNLAGASGYTTTIYAATTAAADPAAAGNAAATISDSASSSTATNQAINDGIEYVTVTVPSTIVTVTVTAGAPEQTANANTSISSGPTISAAANAITSSGQIDDPAVVTPFLTPSGVMTTLRRARRGNGEWGIRQH